MASVVQNCNGFFLPKDCSFPDKPFHMDEVTDDDVKSSDAYGVSEWIGNYPVVEKRGLCCDPHEVLDELYKNLNGSGPYKTIRILAFVKEFPVLLMQEKEYGNCIYVWACPYLPDSGLLGEILKDHACFNTILDFDVCSKLYKILVDQNMAKGFTWIY